MTSLKFVFRPSSKAGRHAGTISLRVIHDRRPKTVSLDCRLFPEEWDAAEQKVIYPGDNPERAAELSAIERRMSDCAGKMTGIINRLEGRGAYTTSDVVIRYVRSVDDGNLSGYAATLSEELRERGRYRTANAYGTVCRGLAAFNGGRDIPLTQINSVLIKRFETHLKERGCQPNTVSYYMRNLRAIYNKAVESKRIPPSDEKPFAGVFTGVEETKKRALAVDDVNRLKNIEFDELLERHRSNPRQRKHTQDLCRAWRLFFFCLYAHGMSFVDMCHLKKSNVREGEIRYYRKKTGGMITVPVNEGMRKIIASFSCETTDSEYLFPVLSGGGRPDAYYTALRTQNRRLKKLTELAGVDKSVSTHVARHSWATICKNELLPLSVISEGLGHASEKMTRKYLDSFDHSILGKAGRKVLSAISRPPRQSVRTSL